MSSSAYSNMEAASAAAASAFHHQPPVPASSMHGNWNPHQLDYHQPQHHPHHPPGHPHPYYNPYFTASHFMPTQHTAQHSAQQQTSQSQTQQHNTEEPQQQQSHQHPPVSEAGEAKFGEAGGGAAGISDTNYEKQPTPSESASSRSPTASNTTSTPISDLAHRMGCFNSDAMIAEAAAMHAAGQAAYDMYGGLSKVASGNGSPSSFYPWMKNYNGKLLNIKKRYKRVSD